ncbi:hypothetical protein PHYPO_G00029730 [Pangasianodon hypophthalmus]|uniref:Uncharacterized protein n=1 Tax=Pangasianodon hypophthalmus TaxID=310915 RepID=A0A5N5MWF7_PANHP|nr:hypothetical protein PHYPO_G00029730 [Pangasianodon hypophthalmus]
MLTEQLHTHTHTYSGLQSYFQSTETIPSSCTILHPLRLELKWYVPPPLCPPVPAASSITALPCILRFSLRTILWPFSVSLKVQLSETSIYSVSTRLAQGQRGIKEGRKKDIQKYPKDKKHPPRIDHPYGVEG